MLSATLRAAAKQFGEVILCPAGLGGHRWDVYSMSEQYS